MAADDPPGSLGALAAELRAMRLSQDLEQVLAEVLSRACGLLSAGMVMALYYDSDAEQLHRWNCFADGRTAESSEIAPADLWRWITLDRTELRETLGPESGLCRTLGASSILSVRFPSGANCGRLLAVEPGLAGQAALDSLAELAREVGLLLGRLYGTEGIRLQAVEDERNRVAQGFHDGPLQTFLALQVQLQVVRRLLEVNPPAAAAELEQLQAAVRRQVRELRELLQEMRPIDLNRTGLTGLLRQLADDLQKSGDLSVRFISGGAGPEPSPRLSREIFQIVREAVTNARKHGAASHIVINAESGPEGFAVTIDDDGQGFQFAGKYTLEQLDSLRLGPVSIKQRARHIGAFLEVESTPGHGSRLLLRVPHVRSEEAASAE
jgi:signal transduction histidine kinase